MIVSRKLAAAAALVVLTALPAAAQRPRAGAPAMQGSGVEAALRLRSELKLTDTQVNQLESLRKSIVAERQNEAREMIELRSRIAAGLVERDEMRKQLDARRDAARAARNQRREQLEKILSEDQREELRDIARSRVERMHMRARRAPHGDRRPR